MITLALIGVSLTVVAGLVFLGSGFLGWMQVVIHHEEPSDLLTAVCFGSLGICFMSALITLVVLIGRLAMLTSGALLT